MFDWLKDIVFDKKAAPKAPADHCIVKIDSRSYPLVSLTHKGFVAGNNDTNQMVGQNLGVTISVGDKWGKFSFNTRCSVTKIDPNGRFAATFAILPPDVEKVLAQYAKMRGAAK
ncbi:MAG: hypothetical protein WCF85_16050 [Rhodospirillaceae bacterium]